MILTEKQVQELTTSITRSIAEMRAKTLEMEAQNHRDNQEVYRDLMEAAKDIRRKAGLL